MKCLRCGMESRIKESDKFCPECGFALKAVAHDCEIEKLNSLYIDVDSGVMLVNGKEINHVTAFSLCFKEGKYGLEITYDTFFKAIAPLCIEKVVSSQVQQADDVSKVHH